MGNFERMKIRTRNEYEVKEVQDALYRAGYKWRPSVPDDNYYKFVEDCYAIETYEDGCIVRYGMDEDVDVEFDSSYVKEHFLVNGEFVTKDYWTQPVSETKQPATTPKAVSTPLQSRKEHRVARMFALLQAMQDELADGKNVPQEWAEEFVQINEENNNA